MGAAAHLQHEGGSADAGRVWCADCLCAACRAVVSMLVNMFSRSRELAGEEKNCCAALPLRLGSGNVSCLCVCYLLFHQSALGEWCVWCTLAAMRV